MLLEYLPIIILVIIVLFFTLIILLLTSIVGPKNPNPIKMSPYECGMNPEGDARKRFSVIFYIIAMLFIVFDVETMFLYPWAVLYRKLGIYGFIEMFIFLVILFVGYIYIWKKGVLSWV